MIVFWLYKSISERKNGTRQGIKIMNLDKNVRVLKPVESSINRFMKSLFDIMTPENMFGNYIKTVSNPKGTLNKLKSFIKKDAQRYFQENSNAKMSSRVKIYDFTQQLLNKLTVDNAFGFFADKMSFDSETILSYVRERISNFSDGFVRQLNEGYMNNDTVMPKADLMDKLVQILQAEGASAIKNNTPESVIKHDVIAWVIKIIQSLKQER